MKKTAARHWILCAVLLLSLGDSALGSVKRNLTVETTPPGATVYIDDDPKGATPLPAVKNQVFGKGGKPTVIKIVLAGYQTITQEFTAEQVDRDYSHSHDMDLQFNLVELLRSVNVTFRCPVEGAIVSINGYTSDPVSGARYAIGSPYTLKFQRAGSSFNWSKNVVVVSNLNYTSFTKVITADDALAHATSGNWTIDFPIVEIHHEIPIAVDAPSVPGAIVYKGDEEVGVVPQKIMLKFDRTDATQSWPVITIRVAAEGYEYHPPDGPIMPEFMTFLTYDTPAGTNITAEYFKTMQFVKTPVRSFIVHGLKLEVATNDVLAAIDPAESEGHNPTQITHAEANNPLVLCRLSVFPGEDKVAYSNPVREDRAMSAAGDPPGIIGANIWTSAGAPLTEGQFFDIDPFIAVINDEKWLFYSSDQDASRHIWKKSASGRGGLTMITDSASYVDTEPNVSPDGTKMAFTSRPVGALPATPSSIWISEIDGKQRTITQPGHSPSWAPNGKRLAYVSPDNKIWTMDPDGNNRTKLSSGSANDCYPVWVPPTGDKIVYASDQGLNNQKQHNYDLWMMSVDGSGGGAQQLTRNGSLDSAPVVSSDGKFVYFFSNRGAQKPGKENLQIFRLDLAAPTQ